MERGEVYNGDDYEAPAPPAADGPEAEGSADSAPGYEVPNHVTPGEPEYSEHEHRIFVFFRC